MDSHILLLCRSLTTAQRAATVLERGGVFASVTKAPQSANPGGCTYAVKLGERKLQAALAVLRAANIPWERMYRLDARGALREVGT